MDQASLIRAAAMFFGDAIKHVVIATDYVYEAYAFPTSQNRQPSVGQACWYVRRRDKATGAVTVPVDGDGNPLMGPTNAANDMAGLSYYDPTF